MKSGNPGLLRFEFLCSFLWIFFQIYRLSRFSNYHSASISISSCFLNANRVSLLIARIFWTGTERVLCVILQPLAFSTKAQSETMYSFALSELVNREALDLCGFIKFFWIFRVIRVFLGLFRGLWKPVESVCSPVYVFCLDLWHHFPFWLCQNNFSCFIVFYTSVTFASL